jgi:hypothetical protein
MRVGLAVVGLVLIGTGCSGEKLAEKIAENRIEAEGGGDVDIDFDDGDVSIKTDDDGNVSILGSGQDGDGNIRIDSENGETVVEGDDGTAVFSQSGDLPDASPLRSRYPTGSASCSRSPWRRRTVRGTPWLRPRRVTATTSSTR